MNKYIRDIIIVGVRGTHTHIPESKALNDIIAYADNIESFCNAHELVNRNRITSKKSKILQAIEKEHLKPFRFLLNKN